MKLAIKTELITAYLQQNNLTIKEFCKRCNISVDTYYRIMQGDTHIRITTFYRILVETHLFCEDILTYK